jgi:hypothetical protein
MSTEIPFDSFDKVEVVEFKREVWAPFSNIETQVQTAWPEAVERNRRRGGELYDATMVRASDLTQEGTSLLVKAELTSYKYHLGTRTNPNLEDRANPLYVATIFSTSDGKLVLGRINVGEEQVLGKVNLVAGAVEPKDISPSTSQLSLDVTLARELIEETGLFLFANYFSNPLKPTFIVIEDHMRHPSLIYTGRTDLSEEDINDIFNYKVKRPQGKKREFSDLFFLESDPNSILQELRDNPERFRDDRVRTILGYVAERGV